jgi:hypothetical protein
MDPSTSVCHVSHRTVTMTLDTIVAAFDTSVALVAVLMSSPVTWRKELWNFSVIQRVNLSNLINIIKMSFNRKISVTITCLSRDSNHRPPTHKIWTVILLQNLRFQNLLIIQ